jgi:cytidylate kinase
VKEHTREEPKIISAAEREMRQWVFNEQARERSATESGILRRTKLLGDYITISREAGACGEEVAQIVGRKLGWEVMDKNILDHVAERYKLSRETLELVDETTINWAYDILGTWLDRKVISQEKYVVRLTRIILAAARRGNVVFVGRGTQFLLPRERGLSVRIIAPEKYRVRELMRCQGLDEAKARRRLIELDRGRREFVQRFFRHNVADPHLYDLVLNVERFGPEGTAEIIVGAYPERG